VQLSPSVAFELPLLQWSYDEMQLRAVHRSPGTVRRVGATTLRNETGRSFREALLADAESLYFIGSLAAGAEVDLASVRKEPLRDHVGKWSGYASMSRFVGEDDRGETDKQREERIAREFAEWRQILRGPFSLTELVRTWPRKTEFIFNNSSAVFLGLSDEPALAVFLRGVEYQSRGFSVTAVAFAKQP